MNFNIEDLIKRIEQLEANTVNNASVYELTKTIDKISTRLDAIEALAKGAASSKAFAPIINEIKNEIEATKGSISNLAKSIKPIEEIEQVVDSARRTYGEELSSFTLKTNKKLDAINEIIGVNNGE